MGKAEGVIKILRLTSTLAKIGEMTGLAGNGKGNG
jgi:hypothetical protein